jgi:DNA-binding transcriptional ArsR family regulator
MSLLPSKDPNGSDGEPRVIPVDSEDADDVLSALSSTTAREILAALHEQPAPPAELADRVDTSVQNAKYHLDSLEAAGAVEVTDTAYSEKGREMDVYAPANEPLVICAGDESDETGVRSLLTQSIGAVGALAFASLLVQQLLGAGVGALLGPPVRSGRTGGGTPEADLLANGTVSSTPTEALADGAGAVGGTVTAGIPPGVAFFAGGVAVLAAVAVMRYAEL